jgi:hypothetical protein
MQAGRAARGGASKPRSAAPAASSPSGRLTTVPAAPPGMARCWPGQRPHAGERATGDRRTLGGRPGDQPPGRRPGRASGTGVRDGRQRRRLAVVAGGGGGGAGPRRPLVAGRLSPAGRTVRPLGPTRAARAAVRASGAVVPPEQAARRAASPPGHRPGGGRPRPHAPGDRRRPAPCSLLPARRWGDRSGAHSRPAPRPRPRPPPAGPPGARRPHAHPHPHPRRRARLTGVLGSAGGGYSLSAPV